MLQGGRLKLILAISFPLLLTSTLYWFYLCSKLFEHLKINHPQIYSEIGEPSLFWNSTPSNNNALLKFLLKKEWLKVDDTYLNKTCSIMRLFFIIYSIVLFIVLFIVFAAFFVEAT